MNKKVVLAMSGGLDSTTLCGWYLEQNYEIFPIIFNYGSKHNKYENEAAFNICDYWNINYQFVDLAFMTKIAKSNLMLSGGDIPEGHYEDQNMKLTVVPGRNLIFASILASYAESNKIEEIALGVHAGDHVIYPDCRPTFIIALQDVITMSTDAQVEVKAPFLNIDKKKILQYSFAFENVKVPYELTRTCYKDQEKSCGSCASCVERLEAFNLIGIKDPIEYEL
jgi:7-cyano-7-deazaguanine synthase